MDEAVEDEVIGLVSGEVFFVFIIAADDGCNELGAKICVEGQVSDVWRLDLELSDDVVGKEFLARVRSWLARMMCSCLPILPSRM